MSLFLVLLDDYFEIGRSLDHLGVDDRSADRRMLAMVVERVEETVHPHTVVEVVSVLLADQVLHFPRETLEGDLGLLVDQVRARKGGLGREHDDPVFFRAGDGTNTRLKLAVKELVECLPSAFWLFSLVKTERRCVPKGQQRSLLDRRRLVQMLSDLLRELDHPLRQRGQRLVHAIRMDRGLTGSQRLLRENEVEDADDIVDVSAFGGFGGDPSFDQPVGEIEEVLG